MIRACHSTGSNSLTSDRNRAAAVDEDVTAEAVGDALHCERSVVRGAEASVVLALGVDEDRRGRGEVGEGEAEAAGHAAVAQRLLQPRP